MTLLHLLGIFLCAAVLDGLWADYTLSITRIKAFRAALTAGFIWAVNSFLVISYTQDHWAVAWVCAGAFVGTYLVVWREERKKKRE